jgi:hypothetical protein
LSYPLEGCDRRLRRARRYVIEVEQLLSKLAQECESCVTVNPDNTLFFAAPPALPEDLPLAISDATHNLRAALDYFVYELAIIDSGEAKDGTQFPIEDAKSRFDDKKERLLRGISSANRDKIEALQPYNGVAWTRALRDISNPDKHRRLLPITNERANYFFMVLPGHSGRGRLLPSGDRLQAIPTHAVQIELPEGPAQIVHTLYTIFGSIVDTIGMFRTHMKA